MAIFRRREREQTGPARSAAQAARPLEQEDVDAVPETYRTIQLEAQIDSTPMAGVEESDVFVRRRSVSAPPPSIEIITPEQVALEGVTLFVYGWENVQPGPLSWVFPSLRAALAAVQTMKNAVAWCICAGNTWDDVEAARAEGAVLVEQSV